MAIFYVTISTDIINRHIYGTQLSSVWSSHFFLYVLQIHWCWIYEVFDFIHEIEYQDLD